MIKNKYRYVASSSTGTSPARVPARRQVKYRYLTGHQLSPGEVEGFVHNYKHLASVTVNCFAAWAPNATHRFWRIKQKRICSINCRPWELADRLHTRYSFLPVQIMNPELHSALMRSIYIYREQNRCILKFLYCFLHLCSLCPIVLCQQTHPQQTSPLPACTSAGIIACSLKLS